MAKRRTQKRKTEWPERLLELWAGFFIAFYLLFPGFEGYTAISPAKTWSFVVLAGLLVLLGLWLLIRDVRKKTLRPPTPAQLAALAFLAFTLLSASFSGLERGNPWFDEKSHEAALIVCLYVLLFLIVSRWGKPTERLFRVLFWSMAPFCLLCLIQALGANPLKLYPGGLNYYDGNGVAYKGAYAGTLGNVDVVSTFLTLPIPMLLLHTRGQKPKEAWPCWVLAAVCVGVLLWIRVLGGLVGLVLGGAICFIVLCPDAWRKWVLLGCAVLGVSALALLWFFDLPGFFHELHEILHGNFSDKFGSGRFFIWRQMLERVPDRLWTGVGPDMVRYSGLEPFVRRDELGNAVLDASGRVITATLTDGHCYPIHVLYCLGLPALLSWLGLTGIGLFHWIKYRRDRAVAILGGAAVCFLCAMLFCISSIIIMPFFWLTLALLEAKVRQLREPL